MAFDIKKFNSNVAIADIDIVNPYFRTKDSEKLLSDAGIKLICSPYANSNLDIPALPQELYSITDDKSMMSIVDVGGDDRGALALGRFVPEILKENDYEMFFVVNAYRPLTASVSGAVEILKEIEAAARLPFTAIINNSNIGEITTAGDVLSTKEYFEELQAKTNLPLKLTTVSEKLYDELKPQIEDLFPLRLQHKI